MPEPQSNSTLRYRQAVQLQNAQRLDEAENAYRALLVDVPTLWQAWYNLGLLYQHRSAFAEAENSYRKAIALNGQLAEAHNNLGNVLRAQGRPADAVECFRRALSRNPALAQAAFNLGSVQQALGRHDAAIVAFRQVVSRVPRFTLAWDGLWRSQLALGKSDDAAQTFLQWEKVALSSPELVLAGLNSARAMADPGRESHYLALALDWPFEAATPAQISPILALLQYFDVTQADLLRAYKRYDAAIAARAIPSLDVADIRPDQRLRIGYVSGDFRSHVMGRLMLDVLRRHDLSKFSLHLYSIAPVSPHDVATEQFRAMAEEFVDLSGLNDLSAAQRIAKDGMDVLIDLGGHTMSARPEIYTGRPARRMLTHLGYHGALGMGCIDGKVSDVIADPPGNEAWQVDPPIHIDACVFPLVAAPVNDAPPLEPPPELAGKFVFAAFANVLKLSPRCMGAWRRVLDQVPSAMLLFSPFERADRNGLLAACRAAGIDGLRVAFLDIPSGDSRLFRRYELVHGVMDTFPYGGGDTTLAALSKGVPVVTLLGQRHAERIGASMLTHLGLPELVAADLDAFVETSARLATDAEWRQALVDKIQHAMSESDRHVTRHVRGLEAIYRRLAEDAKAPRPTSP